MTIRRLIGLVVFFAICGQVTASENDVRLAQLRVYAEVVGTIRFTEKVADYISKKCQVSFSVPPIVIDSVDYQLRRKLDYSYVEFINFLDVDTQSDGEAEDVANMLIEQVTACNPAELNKWYTTTIAPVINAYVEKLSGLGNVFGLGRINRPDNDIKTHFQNKLNRFRALSNEEIRSLANALESGVYSYTNSSHAQVNKDIEHAITLRQYLVEQTDSADFVYQLAGTMARVDKSKALAYYKTAAEKGYAKAQIWLGTYFACNNKKIDALFWLNKVNTDDSEESQMVDLIQLEMQDLGKPANCYNGWVY